MVVMMIPDFIRRCDAYCREAGVKRVWLSKRLLQDTYRLEKLANGDVDIGVQRLERASRDLAKLEAACRTRGEAA